MQYLYNEEAIIIGCKNNDRKSQETLYRHYFKVIFFMCFRYTHDESTALEIVNDAFLTIFKNISKFENRGSLEGWMRKITFNKLVDYFRKEKRNIKFLLLDESIPNFSNDIHQQMDPFDYEYVLNIVQSLHGSFKEVFIKYAIEGYNHKEIGEELNISEGTSKWYLSEARKKLQALLNSNKIDLKYGG